MQNNQLIITSILTLINFIIIIISYIFNKKNAQTTYFSSILKNRLELIYSPLYFGLNINKSFYLIDDPVLLDNINKYSYLLSPYFCEILFEVIRVESLLKETTSDNSNLLEKHNVLLNTLHSLSNSEYEKSKSIYKNTYIELENNLSMPGIYRLMINILYFCFYVFIFSLIILGSIYFIYSSAKQQTLTIYSFSFLCFAFINMIGFCFSIIKLSNFVADYSTTDKLKFREKYKGYHLVPEDGYYICSCCNEQRYFYKHTYFMRCHNKKNFLISSYYKKVANHE